MPQPLRALESSGLAGRAPSLASCGMLADGQLHRDGSHSRCEQDPSRAGDLNTLVLRLLLLPCPVLLLGFP